MTGKINVCLIGCGRAGLIHAKNINTQIDNASLVAICDPSEDSLNRMKKELGEISTFKNYKKAIEVKDIDAIIIATPTEFHKEIAIYAAEHGKHIFCEKPMASTEQECEEIIQATQKNNVKLQIGFMRRFDTSFQRAKEMIEEGKIGDIALIKSLTRGPSHPKSWMYDIYNNYGPIGEVNSHDFDTLRWFAESEVESIHTVGDNFQSPEIKADYPDYYDTVSMNIKFENGMIGHIDGAQYVKYGYDARVDVLGTKGNIQVGEQHKDKVVLASQDGEVSRPTMHSWDYLFRDAYVKQDQAFIDAIIEDSETLVTGHDGKMVVKLVKMGLNSLLEKRPIYANEMVKDCSEKKGLE